MEMNFNGQFDNFSLKSPNTKTTHKWNLDYLHADFIELKALFWAKGSWLTITDVIGHYKDYSERLENITDSSDVSDLNDKWNTKFIEYFDTIKSRKNDLKDIYPFELDATSNYIKLKEELTNKNILYLSLLICSNLNNFKEIKDLLTKEFEKISKLAIEEYLKDFVFLELGENSTLRGNTRSKIEKISSVLNISYRENEIKNISSQASKEKGVDILAYKSFEDKIASMIIVLIQCACGKDWKSKTAETKRYETYLDFYKLKPIHSMSIPYYLSSENGFKDSEELGNKLVFERKRLLEFLKDEDSFDELSIKNVVNKCIEYENIEV